MLCLECGEEMRLVHVTKDTTMAVSGYEHHSWECSACSAVEQRMAFDRDTTPNQTAPVEQTQSVSAEPTQSVSAKPTQGVPAERSVAMPVEPTEAIPVELTEPVRVALTQTKPVEPIQALSVNQTVAIEPTQAKQTHRALPGAMVKTNAWAKALDEKLRNLKERATAAREVAGKTARPTPFNRDWNNKSRPVPPPPASSTASNHVKSRSLYLLRAAYRLSSANVSRRPRCAWEQRAGCEEATRQVGRAGEDYAPKERSQRFVSLAKSQRPTRYHHHRATPASS